MNGTWGQYPCESCGQMYDVRGQCGCPAPTADPPAKPVKIKKPKVARGFKTLKGEKIGSVIADAVNQVTLVCGASYFVIETEVVDGIPVLKCKRHKTVKYKRPATTASKHMINKFGAAK